jgi:hypothetical protein
LKEKKLKKVRKEAMIERNFEAPLIGQKTRHGFKPQYSLSNLISFP